MRKLVQVGPRKGPKSLNWDAIGRRIHKAEQTGRTTSEAPNRARVFRLDLAVLEVQARGRMDSLRRERIMKACRCTGKCECGL